MTKSKKIFSTLGVLSLGVVIPSAISGSCSDAVAKKISEWTKPEATIDFSQSIKGSLSTETKNAELLHHIDDYLDRTFETHVGSTQIKKVKVHHKLTLKLPAGYPNAGDKETTKSWELNANEDNAEAQKKFDAILSEKNKIVAWLNKK